MPKMQRTRYEPWVGTSPGEGKGNSFQYSCPGNSMEGGAWWATVCGVAKELDMTERLSNREKVITE